ncbi:MAG TPA: hypothetical protein VGQ41_08970 [Pyrinomonadaceae bacterium]|nr:hypothetical protein [Pyrinomonadaceae bacterium]
MQFAQLSDHVESNGSNTPMDLKALPGVWINSNPNTSGIARMVMSEQEGKLSLQVFAVGPDGPIDWGNTDVKVFAGLPTSKAGAGFTCNYDFGFAETELQGMIMKGLLVLAQVHRFKDDSKRADFFVREYFALEHGRY